MQRQAVKSSVILSVGYDARSATLEVRFRNGRLYEYFGVPPEEVRALLTADSVGKYFNEVIKAKYQSARVREDRRGAKSSEDPARPSPSRR
jgi:KTSC domain